MATDADHSVSLNSLSESLPAEIAQARAGGLGDFTVPLPPRRVFRSKRPRPLQPPLPGSLRIGILNYPDTQILTSATPRGSPPPCVSSLPWTSSLRAPQIISDSGRFSGSRSVYARVGYGFSKENTAIQGDRMRLQAPFTAAGEDGASAKSVPWRGPCNTVGRRMQKMPA